MQIKDRGKLEELNEVKNELTKMRIENAQTKQQVAEYRAQIAEDRASSLEQQQNIQNCVDKVQESVAVQNQNISNITDQISQIKPSSDGTVKLNPEQIRALQESADKLNNSSNSVEKALKDLIDARKKFWDSDYFQSLIDQFNSFISQLSFEQLYAFAHISAAIFILFLIINIIMTLFSSFLLDLFNLEKKYPRLAKVVIYRKRFQTYYLVVNIFFILLTVIVIIFINIELLFR